MFETNAANIKWSIYKPVAKKVRMVPTTMPAEYRVVRQLPTDPLAGMPELPTHPPNFIPGVQISLISILRNGYGQKN
jgi:hypothetical protein